MPTLINRLSSSPMTKYLGMIVTLIGGTAATEADSSKNR